MIRPRREELGEALAELGTPIPRDAPPGVDGGAKLGAGGGEPNA